MFAPAGPRPIMHPPMSSGVQGGPMAPPIPMQHPMQRGQALQGALARQAMLAHSLRGPTPTGPVMPPRGLPQVR